MRKVALIGTSHKYQCPGGGANDMSLAQFDGFLSQTCLKVGAKAVAEEMSKAALEERGTRASIAQRVCARLRLLHQLSDPPPDVRRQLSIEGVSDLKLKGFMNDWPQERVESEVRQSHDKRELHWISQLLTLNAWPVVFVCGADHVEPFVAKLLAHGLLVEIVCGDWEPKLIPKSTV